MERNTVRGGRGASKGALLLSIYICVYMYIYKTAWRKRGWVATNTKANNAT